MADPARFCHALPTLIPTSCPAAKLGVYILLVAQAKGRRNGPKFLQFQVSQTSIGRGHPKQKIHQFNAVVERRAPGVFSDQAVAVESPDRLFMNDRE